MLPLLLLVANPSRSEDGAPPPVVNGSQVQDGDWEDAAAIYFGDWVECTGVLVAPTVVLTAGHCMGGITDVRLATNDYRAGGEKIAVKKEVEYPHSQSSYDIGLLILKKAAKTTPRLIAQDCILDDYLKNGADVTIVGYGATDYYGEEFGTLLMEGFTTVDDFDCSEFPGCESSVSPGGEIGAGAEDNVDSCYGDSGGPLYLNTPKGDYLIGLTSRAYNGVSVPCRDGGIYVRPDAVIDWIEEETGVDIAPAVCNSPPEPENIEAEAEPGETIKIDLDANDPDKGDDHVWKIKEQPEDGEAKIEGNRLIYTAPEDEGTQVIKLKVTDDGSPEMDATMKVTVDVSAGESGGGICGCASGGSAAGGLSGLLALGLALVRRQSRRSWKKASTRSSATRVG